MNLIKHILTDAKKQKNISDTNGQETIPDIPMIEIDECQSLYIDDKIFEYNMIQRAREAELILNEILENQDKWQASRISAKMDHLLSKFKLKPNQAKHKESDVPKIQISDCDETKVVAKPKDDGEFAMDYEQLFQQASQAKIYLDQLLYKNCECESHGNEKESNSEEEETTDEEMTTEYKEKKNTRLRRGAATKRISYKGQTYTLEQTLLCKHKKRKMALEISSAFGNYKLNSKDFIDGITGRFIYNEV